MKIAVAQVDRVLEINESGVRSYKQLLDLHVAECVGDAPDAQARLAQARKRPPIDPEGRMITAVP